MQNIKDTLREEFLKIINDTYKNELKETGKVKPLEILEDNFIDLQNVSIYSAVVKDSNIISVHNYFYNKDKNKIDNFDLAL